MHVIRTLIRVRAHQTWNTRPCTTYTCPPSYGHQYGINNLCITKLYTWIARPVTAWTVCNRWTGLVNSLFYQIMVKLIFGDLLKLVASRISVLTTWLLGRHIQPEHCKLSATLKSFWHIIVHWWNGLLDNIVPSVVLYLYDYILCNVVWLVYFYTNSCAAYCVSLCVCVLYGNCMYLYACSCM